MKSFKLIYRSLAIVSLALGANFVNAQAFPDRPITLVVPNPPGGLVDTSARLLSEPLTRVIGQPVIVDNKPGASGNTAYQYVAKAKPDGYTLLISYSGYHVGNPSLMDKLPWDPIKDFSPVALLTVSTNVIAVHPSVPVNNLKEFIAYAKANPGKLNYGSAGNGGISHLVPEMLKNDTGIFMVHIPFKGSAPAFTDLIAGHVQFMAESVPQAANYAKLGKVRALAVTSAKRNPALPNTPTVIETGVANLEVVGFYGILAPKGTPPDVVNKLSQAFKETLDSPEVQRRMLEQGADPAYLNADQFTKFLAGEMPRWAKAVKQAGAKLD